MPPPEPDSEEPRGRGRRSTDHNLFAVSPRFSIGNILAVLAVVGSAVKVYGDMRSWQTAVEEHEKQAEVQRAAEKEQRESDRQALNERLRSIEDGMRALNARLDGRDAARGKQ